MKKTLLENGESVNISDESYTALAKGVVSGGFALPDGIKIEVQYGGGDELGVVFNDDKQVLVFNDGEYNVGTAEEDDFVECELKKVSKESLEPGDTVLLTDYADREDWLNDYRMGKVLEKERVAIINGETDVTNFSLNWWKVFFKVERK